MNTHLGDESPSVDALNLQLRLLRGLVRVRAAESSDLKQQGGSQTYCYTCAASQTGANWYGGAQSVYARGGLLGAEREEEVEECGGRGLVDLADVLRLIGRHGLDVRLQRVDELRIKGGNEVVVALLLAGGREDSPG